MNYITFDLEESENSGKHKFISRLKKELVKFKFISPENPNNSDIHLFTRKWNPNAKFNICRIDGICINSAFSSTKENVNYETQNKYIKQKILCSSGIVFQNDFCKNAVDHIIGKCYSNYCTILNGADPEEFKSAPMQRDNPYFMTHCKWRPHKRLDTIIESFIYANLPDIDLLIYGDVEKDHRVKHKQIKYMGWANKQEIASAIQGSIATIHLSWLDWCPNSVVESIVAGKQVIYTNSGGTPLVAKNRGYVIKDTQWDKNIINLYEVPKLNLDEIAKAYNNAINFPKTNFNIDDLCISYIAKQYAKFFRKILTTKNIKEKINQKQYIENQAQKKNRNK